MRYPAALKSIDMGLLTTISVRQICLVAALLAMGAVSYLAASFDTFPGDEDALKRFQSLQRPWLDQAAVVSSSLATHLVAIVSIVAFSLALWVVHRRADAVAVFLVFIPEGLNLALKEIVGRPRPEFSLLESTPGSLAFPSGHALHAFLLLGLLIFIVGELVRPLWLRRGLQGLMVFMILVCGASRVYLGVHWPSDVLGSYLLGGISIVLLLWGRKRLLNRGFQ